MSNPYPIIVFVVFCVIVMGQVGLLVLQNKPLSFSIGFK